ncbi:hypothetical protein Pmani_020397 [Petrolisthes manimaculis]|uniref:Uncharacterized protein n=1 Tax=Petrolisthes manimaculis TaxID=1843537 RepID=A0AAE1PIE5_9EUCA|nr:hypothetical protein Pmani_020397 [Petrolisthes manimaculis]
MEGRKKGQREGVGREDMGKEGGREGGRQADRRATTTLHNNLVKMFPLPVFTTPREAGRTEATSRRAAQLTVPPTFPLLPHT